MKINYVFIDNYRGIKSGSFKLTPMGCIIGENNAGKSSVLLAVKLFFSSQKLSSGEFYDPNQNINIELHFDSITDGDINRLDSEHRERIREIIRSGHVKLVRTYFPDGTTKLLCKRWVAKNKHLHKKVYDELLTGKKGKAISETLISVLPEHAEKLQDLSTIGAAKEALEKIATGLLAEDLVEAIADLPTGIDKSIFPFLPEPILIPAVKDLSDDVKTKEAATFGKLLGIIQKFIEKSPSIKNIQSSFEELHTLLNVVENEKGEKSDSRLPEIKSFEGLVNKFTKENFPRVNIEVKIPKPELKQVFTNAQILVNDGVSDTIENKGDGLKRSLTFALLRSYVEMYRLQKESEKELKEVGVVETKPVEGVTPVEVIHPQPYLFLFEEPELYLHPNAQKILFEALRNLTDANNQVLVSTHSPLFVFPQPLGTFIKIIKEYPAEGKPFGKLKSIDFLTEMGAKNAFQLICFENNAAAFFARKILLVEGDSDLIFLKKASKCLDAKWDFDLQNIPIIRISGKTNVKRFKEFFKAFDVDVHVVLDLDVFIDGIEQLELEDIKERRDAILKQLDDEADKQGLDGTPNGAKVKAAIAKYSWGEKYKRLKHLVNDVAKERALTHEEILEVNYLFAEETNNRRRQVLSNDFKSAQLDAFLQSLWQEGIYILRRGAVEDYYPEGTTGSDKPSKALDAGERITKEFLLENRFKMGEGEASVHELQAIISKVFA